MITYTFNQLAGIGATGIDNDSDIIYMSRLGFNRFFDHGTFVLKGGQVFSIGPFGEPFDALNALDATADINDLSQIVGPLKYTGVIGSLNENGMFTFQTFAGPGGSSGHTAPTGINDNGQVVGYFNSFSGLNENGGYHSFVGMTLSPVTGQSFAWSMMPSVVLDDPALSANGLITGGTYAEGNNNLGQVVGFYSDTSPNVPSPTAHAFLYDNGQWSNLDDPAAVNGTFAEDINDSGVLVGYYVDANRLAHGFVFDRSTGTWTTIDYPGASQTFINGINDSGEIVGTFGDSFSSHTFAATPQIVSKITDTGFDPQYYLAHNPDVVAAGVDPYQHYLTFGWKEGRDPNAFFSTTGYLNANPDVKAAGVNPLLHYDQSGWKEGRDPSPSFDTQYYLVHAPDVAAAGIDPLVDYLRSGIALGRPTLPAVGPANQITATDFDPEYYLMSNPDVAAAGVDPYQHFLIYGWKEGRDPDGLFDTDYYLAHNPDVAAAGVDPLLHYDQYGWQEGRDPSALFSTLDYLSANPDVFAAHVDPLGHFLDFGLYEGRLV